MRGAVSGGMVLALDELGLSQSFDAAYGSSAGSLNAMWLLSGRVREGIPTWVDPQLVGQLIDRRRALRRRPVVGIAELVEQRYEQLAPGLFDAVLASRTELHPIATDVSNGQPVDLHGDIRDRETLVAALKASAMLPLLAGPPVPINGRRFLDAGLSAAIPFHAALADGATHVLVLRSRVEGELVEPAEGTAARATARLLHRIDPAVARAFLTRAERERADEELLARHAADPSLRPHILSVRPPPGSPVPGRLEKDVSIVRGGLEAGRRALHALFA